MNKNTREFIEHSNVAVQIVQELMLMANCGKSTSVPILVALYDAHCLDLSCQLTHTDGSLWSLDSILAAANWCNHGWPVVRLSKALAEAFSKTDPPSLPEKNGDVSYLDDNANAIEVEDMTIVSCYSEDASMPLGCAKGNQLPELDREGFVSLVRNVHYVLHEHKAKSSFDGLIVTEHKPSAKSNRKRGRKYYPNVEYVIGSKTTIHLGDNEPDTRACGSRNGWVQSCRTHVRGFWRHQAHGPKHALRKVIWVKPFWRGPVDAPISIHMVQVAS